MKKRILILLLIICLFICGCKDEVIIDDTPVDDNKDKIIENIKVEDIGLYTGEFNGNIAVLKLTNNNSLSQYVTVTYEFYGKNNNHIYNKEVYVRVGAGLSAYAIYRQDFEEDIFYSYNYKINVRNEELEEYESIYKNIKVTFDNNKNNVVVNAENKAIRTTCVYALVFFYNNNRIVDIKEASFYNITPNSKKSIDVIYPRKDLKEYLSVDKVEVYLNEVSTEL